MSEARQDNPGSKGAVAENLPDAARRALAEAAERRKAYAASESAMPAEVGGRKGKEPVRYGDWEVKGLATDF